jgi:hypothetical protein
VNDPRDFELSRLFRAVGDALRREQATLNQADALNGNHGDHMVEIFEVAARAADLQRQAEMPEAMEAAAGLLEEQAHNGSAQVYAHGLRQMAAQFRRYQVTLDDLLGYVQRALAEQKDARPEPGQAPESRSSGDVLKALASGLVGWGQVESGQPAAVSLLDMGTLFEFGMAYLQARQRGGSRSEVLADAAASVSPLRQVPHRYASGKLAIQALLEAMQGMGSPERRD